MSVIKKLASQIGRKDEVPNQELAQEIVKKIDKLAVKELIENLNNKDKDIQNDCIKVLYEIGGQRPELIAEYANEFIDQLSSKNNRMVWGAMTALGTMADIKAKEIWERIGNIIMATNEGSVITQDWGVRVLSKVSAKSKEYEKRLFPFLLDFLDKCVLKAVPQYSESISVAVNENNKEEFLKIIKARSKIMKPSQLSRIRKVIKKLG